MQKRSSKQDFAQNALRVAEISTGEPLKPQEASTKNPAAVALGRLGGLKGGNARALVERQDLTMRMSKRRFTRLTNGFSKKAENHGHMLAIYYLYYNFCRIHQTLRVTPAIESGIANYVWSIEDMVRLLEPKSLLDGLSRAS